MRGLIHCHSNFSYDSPAKIDAILDKCIELKLDFLVLTDHDTIKGSQALIKRVKERRLNLIVPVAAEYLTEHGDIIAIFIQSEIEETNFDSFVDKVKYQNGLLLFPHPYYAHPEDKISVIASKMDVIEAYNQRCSEKDDNKAVALAQSNNLPTYPGSDAHLLNEYDNVIIEADTPNSEQGLRDALLTGAFQSVKLTKTSKFNIILSQLVKAIKDRNIKKVTINVLRLAKTFFIKK